MIGVTFSWRAMTTASAPLISGSFTLMNSTSGRNRTIAARSFIPFCRKADMRMRRGGTYRPGEVLTLLRISIRDHHMQAGSSFACR